MGQVQSLLNLPSELWILVGSALLISLNVVLVAFAMVWVGDLTRIYVIRTSLFTSEYTSAIAPIARGIVFMVSLFGPIIILYLILEARDKRRAKRLGLERY